VFAGSSPTSPRELLASPVLSPAALRADSRNQRLSKQESSRARPQSARCRRLRHGSCLLRRHVRLQLRSVPPSTGPAREEAGYRPGTSRRKKNGVVGLPCRVFDRGQNIFPLQVRIVRENLVNTRSGSEQLQNIGHADSQATNTGPSTTLAGINCDSGEVFGFHAGTFSLAPIGWPTVLLAATDGVNGRLKRRRSERSCLPDP